MLNLLQSALAGLAAGGAYALLGVCVVLLYRMVGVLNFSTAAVGAFGAYASLEFLELSWPYWAAALGGIAVGTLLSGGIGWIMSRWSFEVSVGVRSTVTIALLIGLLALAHRAFGDAPRAVPSAFPGASVDLGITVSGDALLALGLATALALGVGAFLNRTLLGVQLRALSERPTTAELLGIPARRLSMLVWLFGGAAATAAVLVIAPTRPADFGSLSFLVLPAMAAALLGLFQNFTATLLGGVAVGLLEGLATYFDAVSPYRSVLPFVMVLLALLWTQRGEVWDAAR